MALKALGFLLIWTIITTALADQWSFPAEKNVRKFEFGATRIELIRDATQNQQYPSYQLAIYQSGTLVAKYGNVAFEYIAASPDQRVFVGLSNSGIPGTAFVMFDYRGNLIREVKHPYWTGPYCDRSVSLVRNWYDPSNPGIKFQYSDDDMKGLVDITFLSCDGSRRSLIE